MAFIPAVTRVIDANGNRIASVRPDGSFAPSQLKIGAGLSATVEQNGETDVIEIASNSTSAGLQPCRVAITSNISSFSNVALLQNGVTLAVGDRVLAAGQTVVAQNGVYIVSSIVSGHAVLTRTSDVLASGVQVSIGSEDSANPGSLWSLGATPPITVGATALTFIRSDIAQNVRKFAVKGDGTTDDRAALQAVCAITSVFDYPAGTYKMATGGVIDTVNATHRFARGAKIHVASGVTVTILGAIEAAWNQQIFEFEDPTAKVKLGTGHAHFSWFGGLPGGSVDCYPAMVAALSAMDRTSGALAQLASSPSQGVIEFGFGIYAFKTGPFVNTTATPANNITFRGKGCAHVSGYSPIPTVIQDARTTKNLPFIALMGEDSNGPTSRGPKFKGFGLDYSGGPKTHYAVWIEISTADAFEDVSCHGYKGATPASVVPTSATDTAGVGDPGHFRFVSYEEFGYVRGTVHYGAGPAFHHKGSGAGGPTKYDRVCIYDNEGNKGWWYDSNGDRALSITNCMHDIVGGDTAQGGVCNQIFANGFVIQATSFGAQATTSAPTAVYNILGGNGEVAGCGLTLAANSVGFRIVGDVEIRHTEIQAYKGVEEADGGTAWVHDCGFTPATVPDLSGGVFPNEKKRAIVCNTGYSGTTSSRFGPNNKYYYLLGAALNVSSTSNATPCRLVTSTPHGIATNDTVDLVGTALDGKYKVVVINSTTLDLYNRATGAAVAGVTHGAGGTATPSWHWDKSVLNASAQGAFGYTGFTAGKMQHTRFNDLSSPDYGVTFGSLQTGGLMRVEIEDPQVLPYGDGKEFTHLDVAPQVISNYGRAAGSLVSYTLPDCVVGELEYEVTVDAFDSSSVSNPAMLSAPTRAAATVTGAVSGNGGYVRLTTSAAHQFQTGMRIVGSGFTGSPGTTEANTTAVAVKVDDTHVEMYGVPFVHTYGSGGTLTPIRDRIMLPGFVDGVHSVACLDTTAYHSRARLRSKYLKNTALGIDDFRWYPDLEASWALATLLDLPGLIALYDVQGNTTVSGGTATKLTAQPANAANDMTPPGTAPTFHSVDADFNSFDSIQGSAGGGGTRFDSGTLTTQLTQPFWVFIVGMMPSAGAADGIWNDTAAGKVYGYAASGKAAVGRSSTTLPFDQDVTRPHVALWQCNRGSTKIYVNDSQVSQGAVATSGASDLGAATNTIFSMFGLSGSTSFSAYKCAVAAIGTGTLNRFVRQYAFRLCGSKYVIPVR